MFDHVQCITFFVPFSAVPVSLNEFKSVILKYLGTFKSPGRFLLEYEEQGESLRVEHDFDKFMRLFCAGQVDLVSTLEADVPR